MVDPKFVKINLTQDHSSADASAIAQAVNLRGTSALLGMAASVEHRGKVFEYRNCAVWQSLHCHERGAEHEKELWFRIARHITMVLAGAKLLFNRRCEVQAHRDAAGGPK